MEKFLSILLLSVFIIGVAGCSSSKVETVSKTEMESRIAEESKLAEESRLAEESKLAEESRIAEESKLAEESRLAEESKQTLITEAQNSVKITKLAVSTPNSAGGVDVYLNFYNNSDKTIKYANFRVEAYNAVDDPVSCEIRGNSVAGLKYTGPVYGYTYSDTDIYWDCIWYNSTIKYCKLVEATIDYMDGTSVTIDEDYIGYLF